jgi:ATP-dependent Clp protease ATP-binding subunit ClpA
MSIKNNAEIARRHNHARTELQVLDNGELIDLLLNTVDAKTLAVMTASLGAARARGDREATRRRLEARKKTS